MLHAEDIWGPGYAFAGGAKSKPCFTSPHGDEIWVLLLEKAFAKFCGTFGELNGGQALFAFSGPFNRPREVSEADRQPNFGGRVLDCIGADFCK